MTERPLTEATRNFYVSQGINDQPRGRRGGGEGRRTGETREYLAVSPSTPTAPVQLGQLCALLRSTVFERRIAPAAPAASSPRDGNRRRVRGHAPFTLRRPDKVSTCRRESGSNGRPIYPVRTPHVLLIQFFFFSRRRRVATVSNEKKRERDTETSREYLRADRVNHISRITRISANLFFSPPVGFAL